MSTLHSIGELLRGQNRDDQHFLIADAIKMRGSKVDIYLSSDRQTARMKPTNPGTGPTIEEVIAAKKKPTTTKSETIFKDVLVSVGCIILVGESVAEAVVPLLLRDFGAAAAPNRLTTPAGRADALLPISNEAEMYQEMIFWGENKGQKAIFSIVPQNTSKAEAIKMIKIAALKAQIPDVPKAAGKEQMQKLIDQVKSGEQIDGFDRKIFFYEPLPYEGPGKMTVTTHLDGVEINRAEMCLVIDETNHTFEFRGIYLVPMDISKGGKVHGIGDGDGFGRQVIVIGLKELQGYIAGIKNKTKDQLVELMLSQQPDPLKFLCASDPNRGGAFVPFFWDKKAPGFFLTTSLGQLAPLL